MSAERQPPPPFLALVALVVLPTLVFLGALSNGFHLDDIYRVVGNPELERLTPVWRHFTDPGTSASLARLAQYRPMLPLTLSINYAIAGHSVVGYHIGNLLVHVVSVLLLFFLVRELLPGRVGGATAVALLWGVHPVSGVPVNYICARDLLLMQMFLLGSLLVYVRMRRRGGSAAGWALALLLMALSLLSKTNAVALPLVVLGYEVCLGTRRLFAAATWRRVLPFVALSAGFFAWTRYGLHFSDLDSLANDHLPYEYALTQLSVHVGVYLRNVVWPFRMRPLPAVTPVTSLADPMALAGLAVVVGSLALAWRMRRRAPVASFGILAYWLMFAPTSSVLPLRYLATDYRAYPSLAFLFVAGGALVAQLTSPRAVTAGEPAHLEPERARWPVLLTSALLVWFAWGSRLQNAVWRDEVSLWSQSVRYGAEATAHMNLGRALRGTDDVAARQHLADAIALQPAFALAWINLGLADMDAGDVQAGLAEVKRGVDLGPAWADAWDWYGRALRQAGRYEEAWVASRRSLELGPDLDERLYYAALHGQLAGHPADSLDLIDRLARRHPGYDNARYIRAVDLHRLGRLDEAVAEYRLYLLQAPNDERAAKDLALAEQQLAARTTPDN